MHYEEFEKITSEEDDNGGGGGGGVQLLEFSYVLPYVHFI